jgi:imidazolonepropionase-like amidohydrolase
VPGEAPLADAVLVVGADGRIACIGSAKPSAADRDPRRRSDCSAALATALATALAARPTGPSGSSGPVGSTGPGGSGAQGGPGAAVAAPATAAPATPRTIDLQGRGVVIPGLVETLGRVGQIEVDAEEASHDGAAGKTSNAAHVRALDGLSLGSRAVEATRSGGVTALLARPLGQALLVGQSVAFRSLGRLADEVVLREPVAVHANIGEEAKRDEPLVGSRSGQLAALRTLLQQAGRLAAAQRNRAAPKPAEAESLQRLRDDPALEPLVRVMRGELPLVVHSHRADDIAAVLRLQQELGFRLIVAGGAEAHLLADRLARQQVAVLLGPVRVRPYDFATRRVRDDAAARLHAAGVKLVLASAETHNARNLRWEAGFAVAGGLDWQVALAAVTRVAAEVLGLPAATATVRQGDLADFGVYDGDPLSLEGHVVAVACGGEVDVAPRQR